MAVVGSAEVLVRPAFTGMQRSVAGASAKINKQMGGVGPTVGQRITAGIGTALKRGVATVGAAAGVSLGYALFKGFERLKAIDQAEAKLTGLGHTTQGVTQIMDNALGSVKGTAFGLDEAATVAASTVAAGVKPGKDLESTLRLVADAATIGGSSMGEMGQIFNKVAASNKVQGEVINQLNERGIPIVQFLGETMGKTSAQVTKLASQGKIDFDTFRTAMEQGLGGAALSSGKTFTGALANMQASLGRIGAGLLGGVFPHFAPALMTITKAMGPLEDMAAGVGDKIGKLLVPAVSSAAGWLGRAATQVGKFLGRLDFSSWDAFLDSAKGAGGGALAGLGATFANIGASLALLGPPIRQLLSQMPELGVAAGEGAAAGIRILARVLSFAANNMQLTMAIIVPLVAAYAAWRVASAATAKASTALTAAQVAMTPVVLANNILRVRAITLERQHAIATGQYTVAQNLSRGSVIKSVAVMAAHRTVTLAAAAAQRVATAAQWALNVAMRANPIGLIITAITLLVGGLVWFFTQTKVGRKIVEVAWAGIKKAAFAVWGWFRGTLLPFFTKTIPAGFRKLLGWVRKNWPLIVGILTGPIGLAVVLIVKNWGKITGAFTRAKKWVSGTWRKGWSGAKNWIGGAVEGGRDRANKALGRVRSGFNALRGWAGSTWRKGWNKARDWVGNPVEAGRDRVGKAKDRIQSGLNRMKTWGSTTWKKAWSGMKAIVSDPIGSGRKLIDQHQRNTRKALSTLDSWGKKVFGPRWDKMKDKLSAPVRAVVKYFRNVFGPGGGIRQIFSDAIGAVGRIWNRIKNLMAKPLKFVVNTVIDKGILGALRTVAGFVGMKDKVPKVSWGKLTGAARGRILPGSSSWRQGDDQVIGARRGEGVFVSEGLRDPASRKLFLGANAAARNRGTSFADYMSQHGPLRRPEGFALGGIAAGSGKTYQPVPGSGNRHSGYPWATWAGDFPQPMGTPVRAWKDGLIAAIKHLTTSYGKHIRMNHGDGSSSLYAHLSSILTRVGANVKAGQMIGKVGSTGNSTGPHLHFETMGKPYSGGAAGGGGGGLALPDLFGMFSRGADKAMSGLSKFADSPYMDIVKGLPKKLIGAGSSWVKNQAGSLVGAVGRNFGGDKMGIAKTITNTAMKLGFGRRGAIIGLITGLVESGLKNVNYGDRDSLGVFQQRAPWGPASDRLNPAKAAHMFYTGGQGGQPGLRSKPWRSMGMGEAAQAVQVSAFPSRYAMRIPEATAILGRLGIGKILNRDNGGPLPTGTSLVNNGTGRQEQVVTGSQWDAITSGTTKIELNVNVQGGIVDDRTADKIAEALERRMRRKGATRISARTRS